MLRSSSWLPLGILLLIGALTFWLKLLTDHDTPTDKPAENTSPDMIVEQFEVRSFNPQGQIETKVSAAKMEHFPGTDTAKLTNVRMERRKTNEPPMIVTAPVAMVDRPMQQMTLSQNVVLERAGDAKHDPLRVTTSTLLLDADNGIAKTNDPVFAQSTDLTMRSQGMHYTQESRVLKLSQVSVVIAPKPKASQ